MATSLPVLGLNPVQAPNTLATLATLSQLHSTQVENLLRQQQIQQSQAQMSDIQAEAQKRQRDLADQNTLKDALKDPSNAQAFGSGKLDFLNGKVSPTFQISTQKALADAHAQAATASGTDIANNQKWADQMIESATGLKQMIDRDPNAISGYQPMIQELRSEGNKLADKAPDKITTPDEFDQAMTSLHVYAGIQQKAAALKEAQQKPLLASAQASEATQRAAQAEQEARLTGLKADLLANPNLGSTAIDQMFPSDSSFKTGLKAAYAEAPTPEARQAVLEKGVAQLGETDPGVIQARVSQAVQTAKQTLPVRQAEASYQNALQQGDKGAEAYYKSLVEARQTVATSNVIQRVIDLSKDTENPVAMQQLKAMVPEFTNAAQNIKRLSNGQNTGLSSILDNAVNELTSLGGKPLSDSTIAAIGPYVKTIANGAVQQHNANVDALAQTPGYAGKRFGKENLPYQTATGKDGHKIESNDGGNHWFDAQTGKEVK